MFFAQSTVKDHIRAKTKCIPTTSKILFSHCLKHIRPLKILRNLEKMKLNEPGKQKLDPVSRQSTQGYILTHLRLGKREPLIALACHGVVETPPGPKPRSSRWQCLHETGCDIYSITDGVPPKMECGCLHGGVIEIGRARLPVLVHVQVWVDII